MTFPLAHKTWISQDIHKQFIATNTYTLSNFDPMVETRSNPSLINPKTNYPANMTYNWTESQEPKVITTLRGPGLKLFYQKFKTYIRFASSIQLHLYQALIKKMEPINCPHLGHTRTYLTI
jgi:hypothetical protein